MEHSKKFDTLKAKYEKEYITKETLAGWVVLNERAPGRGITPAEYEEITGEAYDADDGI